MKVAWDSLKLELHPNVLLPMLLEVEDEAWTFTVVVTIIKEDEEVRHLRTELTCSKGEFDSTRGGFHQDLNM